MAQAYLPVDIESLINAATKEGTHDFLTST
jgi:hypothetical protein